MSPLWQHLLTWVIVPLALAILIGGSALLHFAARLLGGRVGELIVAFIGLYLIITFGWAAAFASLWGLFHRNNGPSSRVMIVALLITPAVLVGCILVFCIIWPSETTQELIDSTGHLGCIVVMLLLGNFVINELERRFGQDHLTGVEEFNPNDPNQRD